MAGPVEDLPPGLSRGPQGQGRLRCPGEPHDYNLDRLHKSLEQNQAFIATVVLVKRPEDLCDEQVGENYWELDMNCAQTSTLGYGKTEPTT